MKKKDIIIILVISAVASLIILSKMSPLKENVILDKSRENVQDLESSNQTQISEEPQSKENSEGEKKQIAVYISGQVKNPSVVTLDTGSRLIDAIEKCGGLIDGADEDAINLAVILEDEEHYVIPKKGEVQSNADVDGKVQTSGVVSDTSSGQGTVNINSAGREELMKLPKVGEKTADKIIDYRQKNGKFDKKEDIKNVSGIGDKTYEGFKDMIDV